MLIRRIPCHTISSLKVLVVCVSWVRGYCTFVGRYLPTTPTYIPSKLMKSNNRVMLASTLRKENVVGPSARKLSVESCKLNLPCVPRYHDHATTTTLPPYHLCPEPKAIIDPPSSFLSTHHSLHHASRAPHPLTRA